MVILTTATSVTFSFKRYFQFATLLISTTLYPLLCFGASDGNLSMGMLTATKQLSETHTLFLGGGTLVENFKGDLGVIGVLGKVNNAVTWRVAYFAYSPTADDDRRRYDNRLRGALTYKHDFNDWRFFHRSRLEYRHGDIPSGYRYRPTFNLSHPLTIANKPIRPFVEYEPFYDFKKHTHSLSLYTLGSVIPVGKRLTLILAYFHIHNIEAGTHTDGPQVLLNIRF
ncbi:hypothetical protein A9Q88_08320 [Gammaproteobacteria bacterium 50_400_T64]|nr:hypothetical protein A9Q88_08320 [Gammaproteobacteria bacterium 50_400_T64]